MYKVDKFSLFGILAMGFAIIFHEIRGESILLPAIFLLIFGALWLIGGEKDEAY